MVEIRTYRPSDYAAVRRNLVETGLFDRLRDRESNLRRMISKDPESILVATKKNKVIGSVYVLDPGWAAFLFRLAVRKAHQEEGVGSALVEDAHRRLKLRGVKRCGLFINSDDTKLHSFYTRLGYSAMKKTHRAMWIDF